MPIGFGLFIIFLMLLFNAVFAAYEMALASISRAKLTALINLKKKGAAEAAFMKDKMEASLAVVQVGITMVGAIAAATGGAGVVHSFSPYLITAYGLPKTIADILALALLIIPLSCLTIVFAELIPKTYALNNKTAVCLALSPFMKILFHIFSPVITLFEMIVKNTILLVNRRLRLRSPLEDQTSLHELNAAVSLARTSRLISAQDEKIVLSAAQLSVRQIKQIIIPVNEISMIPINCTLSQALIRAHMDMHTRFPICAAENDPQTIQGYINFKDIMMALKLNQGDPTVKGILRPIKTFREETAISQVLEQMIQEKIHIALISNEKDRVTGMVTLEDILEELVGEIESEFDRHPAHIHAYAGGWIMGGGVPMNIVAQTVGMAWENPPNEPVPKLADWCSRKSSAPLIGGETIEIDGLKILVRKLRRKKLDEAVVNLKNNQ